MSDCTSSVFVFLDVVFTHTVSRDFLLAIISRTFHKKNELKETKTFALRSHFSFDKVSDIFQCLCVRAKGMRLLW